MQFLPSLQLLTLSFLILGCDQQNQVQDKPIKQTHTHQEPQSLSTEKIENLFTQAQKLYAQNKHKQALDLANQILESDPLHQETLELFDQINIALGIATPHPDQSSTPTSTTKQGYSPIHVAPAYNPKKPNHHTHDHPHKH